jgi:L-fucose isomerase-like protein
MTIIESITAERAKVRTIGRRGEEMGSSTFALYFGNRGFFPESLIASARRELAEAVAKAGHASISLGEKETRFGAVETAEEGRRYATFLKENAGRYDGVILSLPNFGDETGAISALQDCGVPILVQAYPDEIGKMDFQHRRDSFCGKFSVMDVFYQYGLPFTAFEPHVAQPESPEFARQIEDFAAVCRIVKRMRRATIGAIGARTTAFKTVRFDEFTLQRKGITVETFDLSELLMRTRSVDAKSGTLAAKRERLLGYTNFQNVPQDKIDTLARVGVALDDMIDENKLDAIALRCWIELEKELGVSPCVLLSDLNDRGLAAACELDVCNAVSMLALAAASENPATCLDWNNNYGSDPDKCILFHCGPVPQSLMAAKGKIVEHPMFAKSFGAGCGWGCNAGRIAESPITFASSKTEGGELVFYLGEGRFTADPIEEGYFGCAGVAEIAGLQSKLRAIGLGGFRHHVSATVGTRAAALREAFATYLRYGIKEI